MTNVVIIHGYMGHPKENWFDWLKSELEKRGFVVYVPQLPVDKDQTLSGWEFSFKDFSKYLNEESIIIAHSMGVPFALTILEKKKKPIKGAFFVAGFISSLGNKKTDDVHQSFVGKNFDFESVKKKCGKIFIYASENDPYVPLDKAKELGEKLDVEPIVVEGAGHFNTEAGYDEFEDLLIDIISLESS